MTTPNDDTKIITPLREIDRPGMHCGRPMSKQVIGVTTGNPRTLYICTVCSHQQRGEELR